MMQGFSGPERVSVYFGGQADEVWTNSGLTVTYKGRLEVSAVRDGETFRAEVRPSVRSGDVKADYNESARSAELAAQINSGKASPATQAYFQAAAAAAEALSGLYNMRLLPERLSGELRGGLESLILPELLRLLLDEHGASWEDAVRSSEAASVSARTKAPGTQGSRWAPSQRCSRGTLGSSGPSTKSSANVSGAPGRETGSGSEQAQ